MGLIHWWPLNGNLYDLVSGNHLTYINNSSKLVVNNSGKLGKCYERTAVGTADLLRSTERMKVFEEESICAWVYISQHAALNTANGVVTNHDHNTNTGLGIGIYSTDGTNYYVSINAGNGSSRVHSTYWGQTNIKGAWHHVCLVSNGTTIRMYVDGKEDRAAVNYSVYSKADYLDIFNWSTGYSNQTNYRPKCKVCDVRVYDHALSEREIKDLAKGLMVHYGLEDPCIEPTTNVSTVNGWSTYASYWTIRKRTDTGLIIYRHSSSTNNTVAISNSAVTSKMAVGDIWTFSCYLYKGGQPYKCTLTSPSTSGYGYSGISCVSRDDGYYAVTFQINSNGAGTWVLHAAFFGTTDLNVDCEMRYMQFEKKDHATPFTLSAREGEVIDNSGNGYNGTPIDIVMSEDSGRGQYAAVFNGTTSGIDIPFIKSDLVSSDWTLSFWLYSNDTNSSGTVNRSILIGDYNLTDGTKFNIEKQDTPGRVRTWFNGGSSSVYHTNTVIPYQSWCNLTITYKSGVTTMYLNGQPTGDTLTYTITSTKSSGALRIGRDNRTDGTGLKGKIADFKMYATALSADEVAYEAKKAKRFFRSGRVEVKGLYEQTEDKACVNSSILQKCARIVEISDGFGVTGEATVDIARDKSYWVQVMHHNNHKGTNMFSSSDKSAMSNKLMYKNDDCWCAFHLITNYGDLGDGYEFLAMDDFWNGQHHVQRWKQNTNPVVSSATPTILSGSCSFGGLRLNNSQAFMSRPSNWWAACGCWTVHSTTADRNITGVPGFTDTSHDCEESMDLFVRVKEDKIPDLLYKEFKGGVVELYEIDEI